MVGELVIPAKAGIQSGASFPPTTVFASCASPPLDSGLRRNDGGGRNGGGARHSGEGRNPVGCFLSSDNHFCLLRFAPPGFLASKDFLVQIPPLWIEGFDQS